VNRGSLCVKGQFGFDFIHHPDRLTSPLIRKTGRKMDSENGGFSEAGWDEALDRVAGAFARYRPDEIAVISSARCTNEENYLIQKLARAVLQTNHIDHCARL
jgi:predicted molibdopterin-dependent oxidoreductase YjgC